MRWPTDSKLKKINWVLMAVILSANLYLIATPFAPKAEFKIKRIFVKAPVITIQQPETYAGISRDNNQLIMPQIDLSQSILEGNDTRTVNKGIWRKPKSATPDQNSNTVLVGHRFSYKSPSYLYLIDQIKTSDQIYVVWNHKIYAYQVKNILTVLPTDLQIEDPTNKARLTIYSCTPLWSTKYRIVIQADLVKVVT